MKLTCVKQTTDYYPFGMVMNQTNSGSGPENKFLYNGKELQDDVIAGTKLDWYDYGARMYDAAVGRFHTQDRFAEKYLALSPYQYGGNSPFVYIEINGDSIWHVNAQGYITHTGVGDRNHAGNHTLYSVNDKDERGASVVIQDGNILNQLSTDRPETRKGPDYLYADDFKDGIRYAVTENRTASFGLFYFLSNNTRVEWALDGYVTNKKEYILATGHNEGKAPITYGDRLPERDLKTINFRMHNHPAHISLGGGPSTGDKTGWRRMEDRLKGIRDPAPHYVYEVREQRLYWYGGYSGHKGVTRPTIIRASDLYRHLGF